MSGARATALLLAVLWAICAAGPQTARAQSLIADLSSHHVAITTGFTGANLLLFGAVDVAADIGKSDIVVIITGPSETITLRRKTRFAGIWVNADRMVFEDVPNFYAVAATRPLAEIADADVLRRQQIGPDNLDMRPAAEFRDADRREIADFRAALVRNKQAAGLYTKSPGEVTIIADRLFRTRVSFPANMITGAYTATVYLIRNGEPVHAQTTPLLVEKVGIGARIFDFAHEQSAAYGALAIVIAVVAGWLASVVFRKV